MIACLQRVLEAEVSVGGEVLGRIGEGLLVFLGVEKGDGEEQGRRLASRVARYRCFPSGDGSRPMDRSLCDLGHAALVVSQFTLCAETGKGLRPGFDRAAAPRRAEALYLFFATELRRQGVARVETGSFGARMEVALVNDGPVTLWLHVS